MLTPVSFSALNTDFFIFQLLATNSCRYFAKKWIVSSTEIPNAILNTKIVDGFIGIEKYPIIAAVSSSGIRFGYHVNDPERYGVVEFDDDFHALTLEEKPSNPKSNYAVPGLYYYDNSVVEVSKNIKPSARGEYEITDVNKEYLKQGKLDVKVLGRGTVWLDTGTFSSLMQANQYVQVIEERQGRKIGCIEEAAYRMGFIDDQKLLEIAEPLRKSGYGEYLINIVNS